MTEKQWREYECQDLGIDDEQLNCLLEIAAVVRAATGGYAGYDELRAIITTNLSASELAKITLEIGAQ